MCPTDSAPHPVRFGTHTLLLRFRLSLSRAFQIRMALCSNPWCMRLTLSLIIASTLFFGDAFSHAPALASDGSEHADKPGRDEEYCSGISRQRLIYKSLEVSARNFKIELDSLGAELNANPSCRVVINGSGGGSKIEQARSWWRVVSIIEYLNDNLGISRNRLIAVYGSPGDPNEVNIRPAAEGEEGIADPPNPHPGLRID